MSIFAGLTVAFSSLVAVNSVAVYIDNDDAHGYSNTRRGFDTYLSGDSHYNGDARRQSTGGNYEYAWWLNSASETSSSSIIVTLEAYVNHSNFTDPNATYYVNGCDTIFEVNSINQNTADAGWNYVGRRVVKPLTSIGYTRITTSAVCVIPSSNSGYNTGADGIWVTLT